MSNVYIDKIFFKEPFLLLLTVRQIIGNFISKINEEKNKKKKKNKTNIGDPLIKYW